MSQPTQQTSDKRKSRDDGATGDSHAMFTPRKKQRTSGATDDNIVIPPTPEPAEQPDVEVTATSTDMTTDTSTDMAADIDEANVSVYRNAPVLTSASVVHDVLKVLFHFDGYVVGEAVRRVIMDSDTHSRPTIDIISAVMLQKSIDCFRAYVQFSPLSCTWSESKAYVAMQCPHFEMRLFSDANLIPFDIDINQLAYDGTLMRVRDGCDIPLHTVLSNITNKRMDIVDRPFAPFDFEAAKAMHEVIDHKQNTGWRLVNGHRTVLIYVR